MQNKHYFQKSSLEKNSNQLKPSSQIYKARPDESDEGGLEFGQWLAAMRRRSAIIMTMTITMASAAVAVAMVNTPIYKAKFDILTQPITVESKLLSSIPESLNDNSNKQDSSLVENQAQQVAILLSPKLTASIIQQVEVKYPGSKLSELKIIPIKETNILEVNYHAPDSNKVQFVLNLVAKSYLQYSLDERLKDVLKGIEFVEGQLPKLQQRVKILQDQLQRFRQRHNIIDPVGQGQQLSNQFNAVVQQRIDTQTQLAKTHALYATLQNQLQLQTNEAAAAIALSEAPRYQNLLNQLQEVQTKIAVESARLQEDNPTIQSLRAQERNLRTLVDQERLGIIGKNLPIVVGKLQALASQNSLRFQQTQQFFDAAQQIQALEAQNKALTKIENSLRQEVKEFPILLRKNDDLERQLKIAVDNLNQFLTKREALRIDAAQKQVPWQLLTPPTKPQPYSMSVKHNLVLGSVLGLLLGTGTALLVDKFKNLLYSSEEIKESTKLPLLGEIIFNENKHYPLVAPGIPGLIKLIRSSQFRFFKVKKGFKEPTISLFWESLRSLYTNIRFLSFDAPVQSLAIISAASEDGRSTIAMYLAQTAALMGQKVLLVDADLRSPKIHTMLGLTNDKGLSNIIATDLNFYDFIYRVNCTSMQAQEHRSHPVVTETGELPLEDNFFVLTAGQVPPNPTSLLSSQKMHHLARQFEAAFDLIVYDTSPILGLADSNLLAAHVNASILVVGVGKTHRSALGKVIEGLEISGTPVLGVVVNGVRE
jgi:capsular exopolysaccharide synthesis family protein